MHNALSRVQSSVCPSRNLLQQRESTPKQHHVSLSCDVELKHWNEATRLVVVGVAMDAFLSLKQQLADSVTGLN